MYCGEKTEVFSPFQVNIHCVKIVSIQSYSGPYFTAFELNTYSVRIQSECGKIRTRITPNTETFYAVIPFYL